MSLTPPDGSRVEEWDGMDWSVRPVRAGTGPAYRCPGCDQEIPRVQPHVVVWPVEGLIDDPVEDRRHWHTSCWAARDRRRARRHR